jgi:hypothetical protein
MVVLLASAALGQGPAAAQEPPRAQEEQEEKSPLEPRPIVIQHLRPVDQRGINVFETSKEPGAPFTGFRLDFNAAFTQQFQDLTHRNAALPNVVGGVDRNQLMDIGAGFNNATANLYLNAQLARGIRVALTTYLSSRHHPEAWVKDGYLQLDASPIDIEPLHRLMRYVTVKVGHFEINYGDAHFRRSDNGNAIYNPFVGNYLLDAFTTEIGAEVYVRASGFLAMGGVTGGEIRGTVLSPDRRAPAYLGKLGIDRQVTPDVRVRVTGSLYTTRRSVNNTLYRGDRAGSRYYFVMENSQATEAAQAWSGLIDPGFRSAVTAVQVNPFVKYRGLEIFGVLERAEGRSATETADRRWTQYAVDAVYRLLPRDRLYVGARYNRAEGRLAGIPGDVGAERWQLAGGWFITPGILAKVEYVRQSYFDFPATDIRSGGRFSGLMLEGVVAF